MEPPGNPSSDRSRYRSRPEIPSISSRRKGKDPQTQVRCEICHGWYEAITYTHLRYRHGIEDPQLYKDEYSVDILSSPHVRNKIAERKFTLTSEDLQYIRRHWGHRSLREMAAHLKKDVATVRANALRLDLGLLHEKWDRAKILRGLRRARSQGVELSSGEARHSMSTLFKAALRYFGSWRNALREAGIPCEKIFRRGPFESWSDERVIREILELKRKGLERDYRYLQQAHAKLYAAARNRFGNWAEALRIASV